jgi:WhiB family redox-sensing transcriptional regulator
MTERPLVMTLVLEKRLGELISALKPARDYSLAACTDQDTSIFFSDADQQIRQALAICNRCPIKKECLEDAITNNEFGVWGGTTELMREQLRYGSNSLALWQVNNNMPDIDQVAQEIQVILTKPVSKLCRVYKVDPRTIYRWRKGIKGDYSAMELINKGQISG